ncbi:MAG: glycosyltransferase family 39 protein [Armatimonadetes bacterium]|nr:glycosyltransferase family 39 protein [Armatimonadota bacterium]
MRGLIWLLVLAALIDITVFGLTDLDEGFYASVAWEMHQRRDWLTPTFQDQPWFEKPPLLYWLMQLSMRLFEPFPRRWVSEEFVLRLPSVVMYALTLVALGIWGNRRLGEGVGTRAALLFAIAPLSLILARLAITDMALTFFLLMALIALWELPHRPLLWSLVGGVALGLAVLTKGPFGLGLVGLLYLLSLRGLLERGVRFRWVLAALGVALLTAAPWYLGVYLQHGAEFFNEFVVKQNLLRFAGGDTAHSVLPLIQRGDAQSVITGVAVYLLFYVVVLWLSGFPMAAWASGLWRRAEDPLMGYLQRWCWLVFGLFTLSFTKLPAYIFPMFPALALLTALEMQKASQAGRLRWIGGLPALLWGGLGVAVGVMSATSWAYALLLGAGAIALAGMGGWQPRWTLALGVLGLAVGWNGALTGYDRLVLRPVRELAQAVPTYRTLMLYRVNPGYPSLQFYRKGKYATADDWRTVAHRMRTEGAYCLTTDATRLEDPAVLLLERREVLGRTFYLLAPRYQ